MPIILKLCQNALVTYYSKNYASIFGSGLLMTATTHVSVWCAIIIWFLS